MKIKIKKGLDLPLKGEIANPSGAKVDFLRPSLVAICPDDYPGFVPKPEVKEGETVAALQPIAHDKADERIKLVSPVAGKLRAIVRGERRHIERFEIEADGSDKVYEIKADNFAEKLMASGLWAMMRQRPYDIVPVAANRPRDIFVTAFDSAPLMPVLVDNSAEAVALMEEGVKALSALTDGKIYIGRREGTLADIKGAEMLDVEGPHPAGNAGTLIAAVAPVNKGETLWTLSADTLREIGRLAKYGKVDTTVTVAVTGPEAKNPHLVKTIAGAAIKPLLEDENTGANVRIISGNVLKGIAENAHGFLHYPYRQLTLMREGNDVDEFMGWASMSPKKLSSTRTFLSSLFGGRFSPDARILGGKRAMILSGVYDRYIPMDIMPEYLLKAIIAKDIEQMEALGIYEVAPEDFALAEYADASKIELQHIVREGLDYVRNNA
ncbi:MAG: NADH:ubiquinone reductase (Na(+)-transporting) subunit A [Muribaculaceae bacterium]|nr:NADH:ubiquinone reductase (Na(+)-transporting) subunit A [Muribaculaceae bacterium]